MPGSPVCRVRHCVNPKHLEPVTQLENVRRGDGGKMQREKTHCIRGHAFDEANTYVWGGERQCKTCNAERAKRIREKRKAGLA